MLHIKWPDIIKAISYWDRNKKYYGIPRGGQYIAAILNPVDTPEQADIIVDDLNDICRAPAGALQISMGD